MFIEINQSDLVEHRADMKAFWIFTISVIYYVKAQELANFDELLRALTDPVPDQKGTSGSHQSVQEPGREGSLGFALNELSHQQSAAAQLPDLGSLGTSGDIQNLGSSGDINNLAESFDLGNLLNQGFGDLINDPQQTSTTRVEGHSSRSTSQSSPSNSGTKASSKSASKSTTNLDSLSKTELEKALANVENQILALSEVPGTTGKTKNKKKSRKRKSKKSKKKKSRKQESTGKAVDLLSTNDLKSTITVERPRSSDNLLGRTSSIDPSITHQTNPVQRFDRGRLSPFGFETGPNHLLQGLDTSILPVSHSSSSRPSNSLTDSVATRENSHRRSSNDLLSTTFVEDFGNLGSTSIDGSVFIQPEHRRTQPRTDIRTGHSTLRSSDNRTPDLTTNFELPGLLNAAGTESSVLDRRPSSQPQRDTPSRDSHTDSRLQLLDPQREQLIPARPPRIEPRRFIDNAVFFPQGSDPEFNFIENNGFLTPVDGIRGNNRVIRDNGRPPISFTDSTRDSQIDFGNILRNSRRGASSFSFPRSDFRNLRSGDFPNFRIGTGISDNRRRERQNFERFNFNRINIDNTRFRPSRRVRGDNSRRTPRRRPTDQQNRRPFGRRQTLDAFRELRGSSDITNPFFPVGQSITHSNPGRGSGRTDILDSGISVRGSSRSGLGRTRGRLNSRRTSRPRNEDRINRRGSRQRRPSRSNPFVGFEDRFRGGNTLDLSHLLTPSTNTRSRNRLLFNGVSIRSTNDRAAARPSTREESTRRRGNRRANLIHSRTW